MDDAERPDAACLHRIAYSQDGLFTARQARECGFSRQLLARHLRSGRYERVDRELYRISYFPASSHEEVRAKWLAVWHERAVVSHESALELHALSDVLPDRVHLLVGRGDRWIRPPDRVVLRAVEGRAMKDSSRLWHADLVRAADDIEIRLRELGDPERAEQEKRYLKSDVIHLGAAVWQIRRLVKSFVKEHPGLSEEDRVSLVEALWARPVHERRVGAAMLLEARVDLVGPDHLPLLERLVRESRTWALVDVLAGDVIGRLLVAHPEAAPRLDRWAAADDFWIRRSALLAMIEPLKRGTPFDRFAGYADAMLEETEFFIRKAIGWVLRETGKKRPGEVFAWLAPRAHRASGVTIREAVKYLEPEQREALMRSYAERRLSRPSGPSRPLSREAPPKLGA